MAATLPPIKVPKDRRQRDRDDYDYDFDRSPNPNTLVDKSPAASVPADSGYPQSANGSKATRSPTTPSDGPAGTQNIVGSVPKKTPVKLGRNNTISTPSGPSQRERDHAEDGPRASPSTARPTPPPGSQQPPPVTTPNSTAIDPLSQHIFLRTNTDHSVSKQSRLRTSTPARPESPVPDGVPRQSSDLTRQATPSGDAGKDKRRLLPQPPQHARTSKKAAKDDDHPDSDSEFSGEPRLDGTNARVFSSIVGGGGYIPHHKEPPRYIRIRAHNKRTREFNRMFLAQELVGTHPKESSDGSSDEKVPVVTVSVPGAGGRRRERTGGAIWATEFSKDGKYLAAAGKDAVVRVWGVISTHEDRRLHEEEEELNGVVGERLSAPVFMSRPVREFHGHKGEIVDLSWSKNNFLLSTSMDKTVRLWHTSRDECLCTFKHKDLVTKVAFHPKDDRFFLAGSLDCVLRLWSIPDKSIAYSVQLPDLITAVAFSPDGKIAIAGLLNGLCMFYETEGLKYNSQIHAKSSRGKNSKGSKITGIQTMLLPLQHKASDIKETPEVKVLISTNDSRIRAYGMRTGMLDFKLKGHENLATQISASFSDDGKYVISGSEDRKTFIWSVSSNDAENKDKNPCECFDAHGEIVTTALFAPTRTRQLLSQSGDPIYDLCNPPPVTLLPAEDSSATASQVGMSELGQPQDELPTPTFSVKRPEGTPAYLERSKHYDGNIIVTSDQQGIIKVFRQDCAFIKRRHESWETGSTFSRKLSTGPMVGRSSSILGRNSMSSAAHSRRGSLSAVLPPGVVSQNSISNIPQFSSDRVSSDRILSWRQGIEGGRPSSIVGSINTPTRSERSVSPSKNARTPASGSRANLAADARKQQYVAASPSHPRTSTLGTAGPESSLPTSPTGSVVSPVMSARTDTFPPLAAAPSPAPASKQPRSRTSKDTQRKEGEEEPGDEPVSPPVPSFSFRAADEDDDALRLDPAGASYSFWNLNRWKGIASLRNSLSGPAAGGGGGAQASGRSSTDAANGAAPSAATEKDTRDAFNRRRSVGATAVVHSPLANSVTTSSSADRLASFADAASRRRSVPAEMTANKRPGLSPHSSSQDDASSNRDHGGGGGEDGRRSSSLAPPGADSAPYLRANSIVSKLSSELTSEEEEDREGAESGEGEEMRCAKCGGREFKARRVAGRQRLVCGRCGVLVEEK